MRSSSSTLCLTETARYGYYIVKCFCARKKQVMLAEMTSKVADCVTQVHVRQGTFDTRRHVINSSTLQRLGPRPRNTAR